LAGSGECVPDDGLRDIRHCAPDRGFSLPPPEIASPAPQGTRQRLSQHLWKIFIEGENDPHRLTVHGLSYLQNLDRERDSQVAFRRICLLQRSFFHFFLGARHHREHLHCCRPGRAQWAAFPSVRCGQKVTAFWA
jgi:hypothetical protein